jgi:hypothetical protein
MAIATVSAQDLRAVQEAVKMSELRDPHPSSFARAAGALVPAVLVLLIVVSLGGLFAIDESAGLRLLLGILIGAAATGCFVMLARRQ